MSVSRSAQLESPETTKVAILHTPVVLFPLLRSLAMAPPDITLLKTQRGFMATTEKLTRVWHLHRQLEAASSTSILQRERHSSHLGQLRG